MPAGGRLFPPKPGVSPISHVLLKAARVWLPCRLPQFKFRVAPGKFNGGPCGVAGHPFRFASGHVTEVPHAVRRDNARPCVYELCVRFQFPSHVLPGMVGFQHNHYYFSRMHPRVNGRPPSGTDFDVDSQYAPFSQCFAQRTVKKQGTAIADSCLDDEIRLNAYSDFLNAYEVFR